MTGTEYGMLYGQRGQGSGRMPGFGDNPNTDAARGRDVQRGACSMPSRTTRRSLGSETGGTGVPRPPTTTTTTTGEP